MLSSKFENFKGVWFIVGTFPNKTMILTFRKFPHLPDNLLLSTEDIHTDGNTRFKKVGIFHLFWPFGHFEY